MVGFELLTFIFGIIVLIVLHELGHFFAARILNVDVEEFGLGFPPRVARLFRAWDTDFTLNAIPLGGFVRPKGENDPAIAGGLAAAKPWVRITVYLAGPLTNLFIGVMIGAIFYYNLGKPVANIVLIDQVVAGSPAEQAGLLPGDQVLDVNGVTINSNEKLVNTTAENLGKEIQITALRGGERLVVKIVPRINPPEGQGAMGVVMTNPTEPITIGAAIGQGFKATFDYIRGVLTLPVRMMQGEATPQEGRLVGYVGMFRMYQVFNPFLFFMVISISLGVINLIPFPALDGGRILMTLPEILFHRRIPTRFENALNLIGFAFLIVLLLYVNLQDFINPIQIPK